MRQILISGSSAILENLAAALRVLPLFDVMERRTSEELTSLGELHPDVILVDAAQVTPEDFHLLIEVCPTIISIDPETLQLTVLSSPQHTNAIAEVARVIGILSLTLHQPA